MHTKIIKDAKLEHLVNFINRSFSKLKYIDEEMYEELEYELYKEVYGCHFNEWKLKCALENMHNEDGTKGGHWTVEETNSVARQHGVEFEHFNEYDWNYVMNMIYSDFYGAVPNETSSYVKLAKKFIHDKDAPKGKALKYYIAMDD